MAALDGSSTSDAEAYKNIMPRIREKKIEVTVTEVPEPSAQRVYIEATEQNSFVKTLNRAGARLVLLDASPSRELALELAEKLNIVVIDP